MTPRERYAEAIQRFFDDPPLDNGADEFLWAFADQLVAVQGETLLHLQGERDTARNRVAALEANGTELLARAERAEAAVERVKAVRDGWYAKPFMSDHADELDVALDGES